MADPLVRLLTKEKMCAYLGEISPATYDNWQAKGIVPGPVRGTNRYDIKAHDAALDRLAGIDPRDTPASSQDPLESFLGIRIAEID